VGIGKQAKVLNAHQLQAMLSWLEKQRHSERNRLIVLLSFKAGLRAKEIAELPSSPDVDAPAIDLSPVSLKSVSPVEIIGEGLDIPGFLRRTVAVTKPQAA
jgi:integrase/recombinase XerD